MHCSIGTLDGRLEIWLLSFGYAITNQDDPSACNECEANRATTMTSPFSKIEPLTLGYERLQEFMQFMEA